MAQIRLKPHPSTAVSFAMLLTGRGNLHDFQALVSDGPRNWNFYKYFLFNQLDFPVSLHSIRWRIMSQLLSISREPCSWRILTEFTIVWCFS